MNIFFKAIHAGEPIVIYGDGTSSRDYIHVDDIATALRLALERGVDGGTVLHIASGVETTVRELAGLCRSDAGVPDQPIEYRPGLPGDEARNNASSEIVLEVLSNHPTI